MAAALRRLPKPRGCAALHPEAGARVRPATCLEVVTSDEERRVVRAVQRRDRCPLADHLSSRQSRQKFEWQAGPTCRSTRRSCTFVRLVFRCKRPDYVPALVAITQTTVLGSDAVSPRARLHVFKGSPTGSSSSRADASQAPVSQKDSASYRQMGNGVNVGAAHFVFTRYVLKHADEIPTHIVGAVRHATNDGQLVPIRRC